MSKIKAVRIFLSIGFYYIGAVCYLLADFISGIETKMTFKNK